MNASDTHLCIETALARGAHALAGHSDSPRLDAQLLLAAYAVGIARNHAFLDGNKRTAFAATYTFLAINGAMIPADAAETWRFISGLYEAGTFTFPKLVMWLRDNVEIEA